MKEKSFLLLLISLFGIGVLMRLLSDLEIYDEPVRASYHLTTTTTNSSFVSTVSVSTTTTL